MYHSIVLLLSSTVVLVPVSMSSRSCVRVWSAVWYRVHIRATLVVSGLPSLLRSCLAAFARFVLASNARLQKIISNLAFTKGFIADKNVFMVNVMAVTVCDSIKFRGFLSTNNFGNPQTHPILLLTPKQKRGFYNCIKLLRLWWKNKRVS